MSVTPARSVAAMSVDEKVGEAIRRSIPLLPESARSQVAALLTPEALAIVAGTLVVWAGSHFFGVGEIVDIILLVVGFAALGFSVFQLGRELFDFGKKSVNATTDRDLDEAAKHFANAISIAGITVITAILLRRSAGKARTPPQVKPGLPNVGPAPAAGNRLRLVRNPAVPAGEGWTTMYGEVTVSTQGPMSEQKLVLYHELVHRYFSPRVGPLRELRAGLKASGYNRSAILKYLEEAMAETYAQVKVNGLSLSSLKTGITFPVGPNYVTLSQLAVEGEAIGTITVGGMVFTAYVLNRPQKAPDADLKALYSPAQ